MNLLGMRYRLGGRGGDGTIDCLGVTLLIAKERGLPLQDVWATVCEQWRKHGDVEFAHGFPEGWRRLPAAELEEAIRAPRDGDVWILHHRHDGVGIIDGGRLWTATPTSGVVQIDPSRASRPSEVWRA